MDHGFRRWGRACRRWVREHVAVHGAAPSMTCLVSAGGSPRAALVLPIEVGEPVPQIVEAIRVAESSWCALVVRLVDAEHVAEFGELEGDERQDAVDTARALSGTVGLAVVAPFAVVLLEADLGADGLSGWREGEFGVPDLSFAQQALRRVHA